MGKTHKKAALLAVLAAAALAGTVFVIYQNICQNKELDQERK